MCLSRSTRDLQSSLQHAVSLVVAYKLFHTFCICILVHPCSGLISLKMLAIIFYHHYCAFSLSAYLTTLPIYYKLFDIKVYVLFTMNSLCLAKSSHWTFAD